MRKLGMNLILFAAFIPAYANPVDCDFENDSCSWSIEGFRRVSTNQLNITDGFNDNMHRNDCIFLNGLCSWDGKRWKVPTKTTTTFIRSPSTEIPMNCSKGAMTSNKTTNNCTTTFVKLNSTDMVTSSLATSVNTSSYYAKDGVIIGIVIGALAFIVSVLLIATYLYRRRAASPNANMSKYRTVSSVTYSGTTRPNTDNVETSQSIDRLDHTSANVSYNSQAVYSTVLKTQSRQSKPQQRCIKGTLNIYPRQTQLLNNDGNNVTNSEQTHNQYLQSADTDGTNSYDTVHNTDNHTTEFRDDTYDCTTIHPTTIPDPIYDHSNFKQNFDHVYDHSTPGSLSKDMRYLDHSCETTLQGSMEDVDPTYDHI